MTDAGGQRRFAAARPAVAVAAGALAVVGIVAAIVGAWALTTATDSERFERRVAGLLQREEISDALAERVVAETVAAIEVDEAAAELVPDSLGPLLQIALAGLRSRVEDELAEIIRTPEVAATVAEAAGGAHRAAIDVIEGGSLPGVAIENDTVRVNLLPLTAQTIEVLQGFGLFADVDLPELTVDDPAAQREQLAAALGRELPTDFGQPIVYRSERLDEVGTLVDLLRDTLVLAKRTFWLLAILGVGAAALSIWVSAERFRTAAYLVAGLFGVTLTARVVLTSATARLPDLVEQPGAQLTVSEIATDLQHSLQQTMLWYSAAALLVLVAAAAAMWGRAAR